MAGRLPAILGRELRTAGCAVGRNQKEERERSMKNTGTLKVAMAGEREIVMTRVFDAPRQMVFDAFSKPELLKRWFGPRGWSLVVCEVDLKVGGGFRFILRGPDG